MDDRLERLKEKLADLVRETAETCVALDRADGTVRGVPHYSVIEGRAHVVGREVSREIQQRHMAEVAVDGLSGQSSAKCPACGAVGTVQGAARTITSIDGRVTHQELRAHCDRCRRDFFPSAGGLGADRA